MVKKYYQMTFKEFSKHIETVQDCFKYSKSFNNFIKDLGYNSTDISTDFLFTSAFGGSMTAKTSYAKGKTKGLINKYNEKCKLKNTLQEKYKKEIEKGNIKKTPVFRKLDLKNRSDKAYIRARHKRYIRQAIEKGLDVPEKVLNLYEKV